MKHLITKTLLCSAVVAGLFLVVQGTANAAITGNCVACHTMHNSQDGTNFGTSTAQNNLLLNGCLGCHTGTNTELSNSGKNTAYSAPIVLATGLPSNILAGGNFYWSDPGQAVADETKGHNVNDIASNTGTLTTAPGGTYLQSALTCSSCHRGGGHHTGGSGGATDGTSAASSYRFLTGGVQGVEDADWEYSVASNDHNVYYGANGASQAGTISAHCALCHGNFHGNAASETGGSSTPWTRHPTDLSLNSANGSEYAAYGSYSPQAPLGSTTTSTATTNATIASGTDIVVCTSCHRAHGSAEPDMLRWSYGQMNAGTTGTTGCFVCHTTK